MRRLTGREKRLIVMTALAAGAVAWDSVYRHWSPRVTVETEHYRILSSATDEQTREVGQVAEIVYAGYLQLLGDLGRTPLPHRKLGLKLFQDREEFRRCNRIWDGTEAFYRAPFCYQYYSAGEANPNDSMMHEATHQLNNEVAGLRLSLWLEEGLACYVATSRIVEDSLHLGELDPHTYLVSWIGTINPSGDLDADKQKRSIIPLQRFSRAGAVRKGTSVSTISTICSGGVSRISSCTMRTANTGRG